MITSALSYTPELGGEVKHRTLNGELWLRLRFDDADIAAETEAGAVCFRLVPILAKPSANTGMGTKE